MAQHSEGNSLRDTMRHLIARCRQLSGLDAGQDEQRRRLSQEIETLCSQGLRYETESETFLHEVTRALAATNPRLALDLLLDVAIRLSGAQRGFIVSASTQPDGAHAVMSARNIARERIEGAASETRRLVLGRVIATGKTLRIDDVLHTEPFSMTESVKRLKLLSILCIPVKDAHKTIAVLYLENRSMVGAFTEETERRIEEFIEAIGEAVRNVEAAESRDLRAEPSHRMTGEYEFEGIVGNNVKFRTLLSTLAIAARGDIPILVEGESGTGKDLIAQAVHRHSPRNGKPFVSVNCAALPHALLESEIFGHQRGAFTGAVRDRDGLFASADGGTLFLDEIGDMSSELQAKLLRVLQSGEYRPVGSDSNLHADVRIVAATQRNLDQEIQKGTFRPDLFFRLNGVRIRIPPLRERREDIPLLIREFLQKFGPPGNPPALNQQAVACLLAYDYPGNVRELETIVRRAVLFSRDGKIGLDALPPSVIGPSANRLGDLAAIPLTAAELLAAKKKAKEAAATEIERAFLLQALAVAQGHPGEAARSAGMNRSQFERMLSRHSLSKPHKQ